MSEPFLKTGEREESKMESVLSGIEEQQREALGPIEKAASLEALEEFLRGKNGVYIHTKTLPGWRDLTKKDKEALRRTADIANDVIMEAIETRRTELSTRESGSDGNAEDEEVLRRRALNSILDKSGFVQATMFGFSDDAIADRKAMYLDVLAKMPGSDQFTAQEAYDLLQKFEEGSAHAQGSHDEELSTTTSDAAAPMPESLNASVSDASLDGGNELKEEGTLAAPNRPVRRKAGTQSLGEVADSLRDRITRAEKTVKNAPKISSEQKKELLALLGEKKSRMTSALEDVSLNGDDLRTILGDIGSDIPDMRGKVSPSKRRLLGEVFSDADRILTDHIRAAAAQKNVSPVEPMSGTTVDSNKEASIEKADVSSPEPVLTDNPVSSGDGNLAALESGVPFQKRKRKGKGKENKDNIQDQSASGSTSLEKAGRVEEVLSTDDDPVFSGDILSRRYSPSHVARDPGVKPIFDGELLDDSRESIPEKPSKEIEAFETAIAAASDIEELCVVVEHFQGTIALPDGGDAVFSGPELAGLLRQTGSSIDIVSDPNAADWIPKAYGIHARYLQLLSVDRSIPQASRAETEPNAADTSLASTTEKAVQVVDQVEMADSFSSNAVRIERTRARIDELNEKIRQEAEQWKENLDIVKLKTEQVKKADEEMSRAQTWFKKYLFGSDRDLHAATIDQGKRRAEVATYEEFAEENRKTINRLKEELAHAEQALEQLVGASAAVPNAEESAVSNDGKGEEEIRKEVADAYGLDAAALAGGAASEGTSVPGDEEAGSEEGADDTFETIEGLSDDNLAEPSEKWNGSTSEDGIEKSVIGKYAEQFGLNRDDLSSVDGFKELSVEQQLLVAENLRQVTLGRIVEEAENQAEAEKRESGYLGRLWKGVSSRYQIAKAQKATAESIMHGGIEMHGEILRQLVSGMKSQGPEVRFGKDGKTLELQFASGIDGVSEDESAVVGVFNEVANEYARLPYEWSLGTASGKERDRYVAVKERYDAARRGLEAVIAAHVESLPAAYLSMNGIDEKVWMMQFLQTNPAVEERLRNIKDQNAWRTALAGIIGERGAYMAYGYAGRTIAASVLGTIGAAAATGGVIGVSAVLGWFVSKGRATKELIEQEKGGRRGKGRATLLHELSSIREQRKDHPDDENLAEEELEIKRQMEVRDAVPGEKNSIHVDMLSKKLEKLIEKAEDVDDEAATKKAMTSLRARITYTRRKLEDGLVDFGKKADARVWEQYDLIQLLSRAEAVSELSPRGSSAVDRDATANGVPTEKSGDQDEGSDTRTLEERLDAFLDIRSGRIEKAQEEYIRKQAKKGAAYAGGFALAGAAFRFAQEHGVFSDAWHSVREVFSPAASHEAAPSALSEALPQNGAPTQSVEAPAAAPSTPVAAQPAAPAAEAPVAVSGAMALSIGKGSSIEGELIRHLKELGMNPVDAASRAHTMALDYATAHNMPFEKFDDLSRHIHPGAAMHLSSDANGNEFIKDIDLPTAKAGVAHHLTGGTTASASPDAPVSAGPVLSAPSGIADVSVGAPSSAGAPSPLEGADLSGEISPVSRAMMLAMNSGDVAAFGRLRPDLAGQLRSALGDAQASIFQIPNDEFNFSTRFVTIETLSPNLRASAIIPECLNLLKGHEDFTALAKMGLGKEQVQNAAEYMYRASKLFGKEALPRPTESLATYLRRMSMLSVERGLPIKINGDLKTAIAASHGAFNR